jgi:hypothetical protein
MPNPLVNQGTLNRLRASVLFPSFPELNVTSPFLGDEGITISFEGESTVYINTMTGAVTSPEPYLLFTMRIALLKTQPLSSAYKAQMEADARLGDCTVRPDAATLSPYQLTNTSIANVEGMMFNGKQAIYPVTIKGYYIINNDLFNAQ